MEIIDLTRKISKEMAVFPGQPPVQVEKYYKLLEDGRNLEKISLSTHCGTHIDAPYHFLKDGITSDKIPLTSLVGLMSILDFTHKRSGDEITNLDLRKHLTQIQRNKRIIIRTDWEPPGPAYFDNYPTLTIDACELLCDLRIEVLGMDTPSPGPIGENGSKMHERLLVNNVSLIEGLVNLKAIKTNPCFLLCLPLDVVGTSGSPCRVVALEHVANIIHVNNKDK
ncbi:cyclase family protein [Chloroflexota bacterium]